MVQIDHSMIRQVSVPAVDNERVGHFSGVPVAVIGDAMGRMNMCDAGIRPMTPGVTIAGRVFPVQVRAGDNAGIHATVETIRPGDVLVVNGQGDMSRALFGGLLARRLQAVGVQGVVLDGCVRDSAELPEIGFPVWARGVTPAGPYKNGPAAIGEAVAIGGVVAHPNDLIAADDDGVVIIPAGRIDDVYAETEHVIERESQMLADLSR